MDEEPTHQKLNVATMWFRRPGDILMSSRRWNDIVALLRVYQVVSLSRVQGKDWKAKKKKERKKEEKKKPA